MTLEEIIIEESHNLSFPHGRNLRSIAFHVRKLEDWAKQLENENDTFKNRIKRLEEAGDKLEYASVISEAGEDPNGFEKLLIAQREWREAKDEKP